MESVELGDPLMGCIKGLSAVPAEVGQKLDSLRRSNGVGSAHVAEEQRHPIEGLLDLADLIESIKDVFDGWFFVKHF